jgi:asparagine synthase (glutamine-hydrolysing)
MKFTVEEGIEILEKLIWHLETYDDFGTSKYNVFLCRKRLRIWCKVVLSGEGADEIFGGYLYFRNALEDFQKETIERVKNYSQLIY